MFSELDGLPGMPCFCVKSNCADGRCGCRKRGEPCGTQCHCRGGSPCHWNQEAQERHQRQSRAPSLFVDEQSLDRLDADPLFAHLSREPPALVERVSDLPMPTPPATSRLTPEPLTKALPSIADSSWVDPSLSKVLRDSAKQFDKWRAALAPPKRYLQKSSPFFFSKQTCA